MEVTTVKTIEEVMVQKVSFALVRGHTGVTIRESGNGSVFSFVYFLSLRNPH